MNASIDLGNTQTKIGLFSGERLVETFSLTDLRDLAESLKAKGVTQIIFSQVGKVQFSLVQSLKKYFQVWVLTHQTAIPIQNKYGTPETLGMDRLAGIIGAWTLFPNQASLVIDMGTCITYDFITQSGEYIGGSIAPGMHMRARAMHEFTAKLPMATLGEQPDLIGTNTQECLQSGAMNGVRYETEGIIHAYQERFGLFNTVLCGGDTNFFATQLKASIFARPEAVLVGLNAVLQYNLSKTHASVR